MKSKIVYPHRSVGYFDIHRSLKVFVREDKTCAMASLVRKATSAREEEAPFTFARNDIAANEYLTSIVTPCVWTQLEMSNAKLPIISQPLLFSKYFEKIVARIYLHLKTIVR